MSDVDDFHFICAQQQQPCNINNPIRKQQPVGNASKLVNAYLSTAVQYLNRTKSFHVPNIAVMNNNNNNNNYCPRPVNSIDRHIQSKHLSEQPLATNGNLARSVPADMHHLIPSPSIQVNISSNGHPKTPISYHNHRFPPIVSDSHLNTTNTNGNKPQHQGIVSTLRRSLRKNKERFYNKRSTTMKSCNSLASCENQIDHPISQTSVSMTPTMLCRRHHMRQETISSCSTIDMKEQNNSDDRMSPLQPLAINGREPRSRTLANGPSSSVLPPTSSLSSLLPLTATKSNSSPTANVTFTIPTPDLQQQTTNGHKSNVHSTGNLLESNNSQDIDERDRLKNDVQQLKTELQKSKDTIVRLQKSEEQMRERLAEQAQRQLEKCGKFEDLNQTSRPTELIRAYNSLYSQARIDALDALDNVREMSDAEDLKSKLLFSVVVLAFRYAQIHAKDVRIKIKQILQFTGDKSSMLLEETIEKYLRGTIQKYDIIKIAFEVENQLWATLYDYPALKSCNELLKYITHACRTAWGLVNQTPAFYIEFQSNKYDRQLHERFHTSDNESETIVEYIWPCLIDGRDRMCVAKGVVITDEHSVSKTTATFS